MSKQKHAEQLSETAVESQEIHSDALDHAVYVSDSKCAECHQEIYDSYQKVAMAKSFYDFSINTATEDFQNNTYYHKLSDNYYRMDVDDGELFVTRFKKRPDNSIHHTFRQKVDYVIGSGNHVRTYLYRNEIGEMFQLPIVWYSQDQKWGMAPGYDRPDHLDFHRPITRACMFCHNAYPKFESGSDSFGQPHLFPKDMPQGIGCQRCHGPGSEHIRLSDELDANIKRDLQLIKNSVVNTGKMDAQTQDDVCFQCHLQPMSQRTSFVRKLGCGDYGYTAGQKLENYMIHFEPDRDNESADHFEINHHPYRLRQSKCFTNTDGGIRCTDCHDPHRKIAKSDQPDFYRDKCFTCHQKDDCLDAAGLTPSANCVACHMPERRTTDVVNVTMTDHKISRKSKLKNPVEALSEIDVPIDMPIRPYQQAPKKASGESLLYQYFARVLDDDESAFDLLEKEIVSKPSKPIPPSLQLLQKRIEHREFENANRLVNVIDEFVNDLSLFQLHRSVLEISDDAKVDSGIPRLKSVIENNSNNANAWYNLGVAYAKTGADDDAIPCLEKAISLRPNYVKPRLKLGSLLALRDKYDEARENFEAALALNVRSLEAYQKLASVYRRSDRWNESILILKDALLIAPNNQRIIQDLVLSYLDIKNQVNRNASDVAKLSQSLSADGDKSEDTKLIKALSNVESNQLSDSLKLLSDLVNSKTRRAEVGLVVAIAQKKIGATETANANFKGAKKAIVVRDRLSRIILEYANFVFENSDIDN